MQRLKDRGVRVWIVRFEGPVPADWWHVPQTAVALCEAQPGWMTASQAAAFIEGFNREMIQQPAGFWSVGLWVTIRFVSDARPGEEIGARAIAFPDPPPACSDR